MFLRLSRISCADPEGGTGVRTPQKNHKNIGFLFLSGTPENHKATKPAFNVGPSWHASEMPFKWRFAGGPMMARF